MGPIPEPPEWESDNLLTQGLAQILQQAHTDRPVPVPIRCGGTKRRRGNNQLFQPNFAPPLPSFSLSLSPTSTGGACEASGKTKPAQFFFFFAAAAAAGSLLSSDRFFLLTPEDASPSDVYPHVYKASGAANANKADAVR